jgi:hypothetical protein
MRACGGKLAISRIAIATLGRTRYHISLPFCIAQSQTRRTTPPRNAHIGSGPLFSRDCPA